MLARSTLYKVNYNFADNPLLCCQLFWPELDIPSQGLKYSNITPLISFYFAYNASCVATGSLDDRNHLGTSLVVYFLIVLFLI